MQFSEHHDLIMQISPQKSCCAEKKKNQVAECNSILSQMLAHFSSLHQLQTLSHATFKSIFI